MKNDQYFKHDAGASCNQKIMRLIDELGMKGYGAYWVLQETLRMQKNYRAPMDTLNRIARRARVMPAFLLRIINNYDLFVVEEECFYSPGMLRRMRAYDTKTTPTLHQDTPLEGANSLEISENTLPNARKEEKKERREEKKEKKKEEEEEILRQAQNDSRGSLNGDTESQNDNESRLTPQQVRRFVNGVDHWQEYIDEAFSDRSWLEVIAMHSGMGAKFMPRLPEIRDFFKRHVRTYGKEQTICSVADAKSYFGNFVRRGMPTQKALLAELAHRSARQVQNDPYRYEERDPQTGQRTYCGGLPIPEDAPPRPSENAVWSEELHEWSA